MSLNIKGLWRRRTALLAVTFALAAHVAAPPAYAQSVTSTTDWRAAAPHLGSSARVLLIGTRPEDDDNALVAWLSLGRHVETAFLSMTRGESGVNAIGAENEFPLGSVRTAELLGSRGRDHAHQYFSRAYDFGFTNSDSVAAVMWPKDSLLRDVVSVIRAYRPHVIIVLASEIGERDATRRMTARLAAEAFALAADSLRMPPASTSRLSVWSPSRLFTRADARTDAATTPGTVSLNVGEYDVSTGRSFAEVGAEIRKVQRTQGGVVSPPIGVITRRLRLDSSRVGTGPSLFGSLDTTLARFRMPSQPELTTQLDSLRSEIDAVVAASQGSSADLAVRFARVARRASVVRLAFPCRDESGVPACANLHGDFAVALNSIRERATQAMLGAAGIVIDGVVDRQVVAAGDTVPVSLTLFNGGTRTVGLRRLATFASGRLSVIVRDTSIAVLQDSAASWSTSVRMPAPTYFWWQIYGLLEGTRVHDFRTSMRSPVIPRLISGEDRIATSGVKATIALDDVEVPIIVRPLSYRTPTMLRGDVSRPLIGVQRTSVLLDRSAEYEWAATPIDRVFRVYVSSARDAADTLLVRLIVPTGLRVDSVVRRVALPPFGARNVFFRVQGSLPTGEHVLSATAQTVANLKPSPNPPPEVGAGVVVRDYPHIPSQNFIRIAEDRLEAVNLRVPPTLRVAYVRGLEDLREPLSQLKVNAQMFSPLLLAVVNLRQFTTILVGAGALSGENGAVVVPRLQSFVRDGGTVVVLPGGDEVARSGLFNYNVSFGDSPRRVNDPAAIVRVLEPKSPLLNWPNVLTAKDFERWFGYRARGVPASFDPRFAAPIAIDDPGQTPLSGGILVTRLGKGTIIYTSLSLDLQLDAAHPGAARLLVNMLSAGLAPAR